MKCTMPIQLKNKSGLSYVHMHICAHVRTHTHIHTWKKKTMFRKAHIAGLETKHTNLVKEWGCNPDLHFGEEAN